MNAEWPKEIHITEFGQDFHFTVLSNSSDAERMMHFDFTEAGHAFVITVQFDRNNRYEPYTFSISPEDALSYPHLSELFNKHLKGIIEANKRFW